MTKNFTDYTYWIPKILAIASEAAEAIRVIYLGKIYEIKSKLDHSPVTEADLISHRIIEKGLFSLEPNIPILSEEGREVPFQERSKWNKFWLVDPLDGTQEFIRGSSEFTVNIALIENHQVVLGIVVAPILQHYYWGTRGGQAFYQEKNKPAREIRVNKIPHNPLKIAVSRHPAHNEKAWKALLDRLKNYELVYCGSALKICLVAKGEADIYPRLGPTSEWDTAAGQCILEAAGGALVDFSGHALQFNSHSTLINPGFYAVGSRELTTLCCG